MRHTVMAALLALVSSAIVVAGPAPEATAWHAPGFSADWDGDGRADVVADDLQGRLWLYPGNGSGGFAARRQIGSGWQTFDEVRPVGDFNGDGHADMVARDRFGDLWLYSGDGSGGFRSDGSQYSGGQVGRGWHVFRDIVGLGDWTGDGLPDIGGLRRDTGAFVLYPGDGSGGFLAARTIGSGWQTLDGLTSAGDWDEDGDADLLARNAGTGDLLLYRGDGLGGFDGTAVIGRGWKAFTSLIGPGDFSGDGWSDVIARNRAGDLVLYRGGDGSGFVGAPTTIGRGWNALDLNQAGVITTPAGTAAAALATLRAAGENRSGYALRHFRHWVDANRDCQNTRNEVLIRDSRTRVEFHDINRPCAVHLGNWTSYLDGGQTYGYDTQVAVAFGVHVAEAWDSGARAWTAARRQAFANDLGYRPSLTVVAPATTRARGDRDPAQWQPSWPSARCAYAVRWVAVKYRWRLNVDLAERSALADVLTGTCGFSRLTLPPRP